MNYRVIVSAVIEKDGAILMGRKPKDAGPYPNTWQLPGGGVELGEETVIEALRREIREEAGIEIEDIKPLFIQEDDEPNQHGEMTHYIFLVFSSTYQSGELEAMSDMVELKWFPKDEIHALPLPRPGIELFKHLGLIT